MATILKCKMCGGDISVNADMTVGTCQYCGSTMTLPHIDTDKKARLFNHANQYRLNNEFDKAYDAYKAISEEDEQEAEAYWGMLLSEYGVEYVQDPKTKKRVPTCHRTIIQPIKKSSNYELACKYADIENRFMYQNEAEALDKIQKKIMSISSQQEQYDVFICYKESEERTSERTSDSVLAQQIYDELSRKGFNTFFSRVTLKDKLGEDYEPFIYSALKSSKIMILVSTSAEHCESPWVRNEWSRFIAFMSDDKEKKIIPAFKDMTAYELPDELAAFQSQDMSKIGAVQDLVMGVESLLRNKDNTKKTMSEQDVLSIVKENKEKERQARNTKIKTGAHKAARIVLIIATVVLLLILIIKGAQYINESFIIPNNTYKAAVSEMNNGNYTEAIKAFKSITNYKDSSELLTECLVLESLETLKNEIASADVKQIENQLDSIDSERITVEITDDIAKLILALVEADDIDNAVSLAEKVDGKLAVKDESINKAIEEAFLAKEAAENAKKEEENKALYDRAEDQFARNTSRGYSTALDLMAQLAENNYSDSKQRFLQMEQIVYEEGVENYNQEKYSSAKEYFSLLSKFSYSDSAQQVTNCDNRMLEKEEQKNAKFEQLAGSWRCSNYFKTEVKFSYNSNSGTMNYSYDVGNGWSSGGLVTYNDAKDEFNFTWVSQGFSATINGNQLVVKSNDPRDAGFFGGTYRRVSD